MFRAPTQTPPVGVLLDDLPTRDARAIARHLGVSTRTLARWKASGNAPRLAHLALFWESRYGASVSETSAFNEARRYAGLAAALERESAMLRARIARLERLGEGFGAANAPTWQAR